MYNNQISLLISFISNVEFIKEDVYPIYKLKYLINFFWTVINVNINLVK